ncbi:protein GVQW3-like [Palaemon carinicauda]|uniref:protein GVQW3-like n=1 Tax=Palaemon carinicauda TaxID=392227 RepID=UPI0035B64889
MLKLEQHANIKFCFKLNKSATETHQMLRQVYGDTAVSHKTVCKWFGRCKEGKESRDDDDRSGRPSTSRNDDNIAAVKTIIRSNRRLTIRELSEETNLSFGSVQVILTDDLNMRHLTTKFVPCILTAEQKESRFAIPSELFERSVADAAFLSSIVTGDESWVHGYDPVMKVQSSEWKTPSFPAHKKARMSKSLVKVMLIAFFDMEELVHIEFVPRGCAVNAILYVEVLKRLRESIIRKRPEKLRNGWLLHHDNSPSHTSLLVRQFMAGKNLAAVPHPPYSPDLAPCDFWLFPKMR